MLARAFHDDPAFGWMLPAEGSRHRRLRFSGPNCATSRFATARWKWPAPAGG